ncbi:putative Protein transport protein SEC24 [Blattamonas nauphoetae]|uniref:Uncharacterized protein n=1 Tax=Blattamonas nauphoetae TaxID=2049346 RepID=A0ABQ9YBW7_9EUKA|nr:putative Protein transport protein SEC24 [Blattamonas nauphoetae]
MAHRNRYVLDPSLSGTISSPESSSQQFQSPQQQSQMAPPQLTPQAPPQPFSQQPIPNYDSQSFSQFQQPQQSPQGYSTPQMNQIPQFTTPTGTGTGPSPFSQAVGDVTLSESSQFRTMNGESVLAVFREANAHPDYFRPTVAAMPNKNAVLSKWPLPFGAIIHPFAQSPRKREPIPYINFYPLQPIRCKNCRSYINPFVFFIDDGRRWKCNFCSSVNEVHQKYYSALDPQTGRRTDIMNHPELRHGSIEVLAPKEYRTTQAHPNAYVFVIDVSFVARRTGFTQIVLDSLSTRLESLIRQTAVDTLVSIVAYDETAVHFFNLAPVPEGATKKVRIYSVTNTQNLIFPTITSNLLCPLHQIKDRLTYILITAIPALFPSDSSILENKPEEEYSNGGAAINAASELMKDHGGTILWFLASSPAAGPGPVRKSYDQKVIGTDKENVLLSTTDQYYKELALSCYRRHVGVNIFAAQQTYLDLPTLASLPQFTGGDLFSYTSFLMQDPLQDAAKLRTDITTVMERKTGLETVIRIRCSRGISASLFYGHFMLEGSDVVGLPNQVQGQAIGLEFSLDDSLIISTVQEFYVQVASLFTSPKGERRIRIHTYRYPVAKNLHDMFRAFDPQATLCLQAKILAQRVPQTKFPELLKQLDKQASSLISTYASITAHSAQQPSENFSAYLTTLLALQKSALLRTQSTLTPDQRCVVQHQFFTMPVRRFLAFVYPRVYALHQLREGECDSTAEEFILPPLVKLNSQFLTNDGVYLVENGNEALIFVCRSASEELKSALFVPTAASIQVKLNALSQTQTDGLADEDDPFGDISFSGGSSEDQKQLSKEAAGFSFLLSADVSAVLSRGRVRKFQLADPDHSVLARKTHNLISYLALEYGGVLTQPVYVIDNDEDTAALLHSYLIENESFGLKSLDQFVAYIHQLSMEKR